jgi:hypothetical protein
MYKLARKRWKKPLRRRYVEANVGSVLIALFRSLAYNSGNGSEIVALTRLAVFALYVEGSYPHEKLGFGHIDYGSCLCTTLTALTCI